MRPSKIVTGSLIFVITLAMFAACVQHKTHRLVQPVAAVPLWAENASQRGAIEAGKQQQIEAVQQQAAEFDPNVYMQNNCFHSYMIGSKAEANKATWYFTVFDKSCGITINGVACSVMYNVGDKSIKEFC